MQKLLLLDKSGDVYKVVSQGYFDDGINYLCEKGTWCSIKGDYLFDVGLVEKEIIHEDDVECVDSNTQVIINAKSSMMGFDIDYIDEWWVV